MMKSLFAVSIIVSVFSTGAAGLAEAPDPPDAAVSAVNDQVSEQRVHAIVTRLAAFGTRHTLSETEADDRGIGAARRWIHSEFQNYAHDSGRPDDGPEAIRVYFDSYDYGPDRRRVDRPIEVVNVVMEVPGSMPEARDRRYYIIGHYDSRASSAMDTDAEAPGANDDASGVAATMELARVMSRLQFDATLVFMATAGEEQGLLGARLHADRAANEGLDIRAVLSNDIIGDPTAPSGARHDTRVRVFSEGVPRHADASELARIRSLAGEHDSPSRQLARHIAEVADWHELPVRPMLVFRPDRFLRGGDHSAFNDSGFAAVRFCEVEENYTRQHQDLRMEDGIEYGDTAEHVDAAYLANVTRLNGAALVHLANAPSSPPNARIIIASLSNDTTIRWDPSPEPDVAGYEVVWRETTSPVWTHSEDVGAATETALPLSKDNYFFGVRAYDEAGFRSPVSWPVAAQR